MDRIKAIIKDIVKQYGINKVHYSLATLDEKLDIALKFNQKVDSNPEFLGYIDSIRSNLGGSDWAKSLGEAKGMFIEDNGGRVTAKKVLVVFIDDKSSSKDNDMEDSVRVLEDAGIRVIPIGLDQAEKAELETLTLVEEDVLMPPKDESPEETAKDIMDRALNGKCFSYFLKCLKDVVPEEREVSRRWRSETRKFGGKRADEG